IVGAGIFRDLALHGHEVLLVDKNDFCAETSSKSSKMLHGGIRYLENFEFHLVYEALHEKNLWAHLTPHLCKETPFLIPVFEDSLRPLWMIRAGLLLYDLLSGFSNHHHQILGRKETQKILPGLKSHGLKGAGVYYDCIVDDTKLGLEVIYDGLLEPNAQALNHVELINLTTTPGSEIIQTTLRDNLTHTLKQVSANQVVVAAGPFTDIFMNKILGTSWPPCLLPNKGSHLWFKKEALPIQAALVIQDKKGRIIFVIPHNERILVGTTEVLVSPPFENLTASPGEIQYLINLLQDYFPHGNFGKSTMLSSFAGVRPLVRDDNSSDLSKTAREHKLYFPMHNLCVIAGGKYTTFRKMAEDVASWAQHR
ncbi:MAG: glycerol-3-phosphate dehydrogenase/oxidase, partial [Bdellovibrionota bacterium]